MAVACQNLEESYQRLTDDELQRLLASGELTALASEVAAAELQHRGVAIEPEVAADGGGNLVLLARYTSPIEAEIARGRLEAEGIFTVVADAQVIQMMSFMSHAFGGVRLLVRRADLIRAGAILQSI